MTESEEARVARQMAQIFAVGNQDLIGWSFEDLQTAATMRAEQARAIDRMHAAYRMIIDDLIALGVHPDLAKILVEAFIRHPDAEHDRAITNAAQEAIRERQRREGDDHG